MLKNYILISFRNLRKHFSYSFINITGLGLGLATCLLLVLWISHELSYDQFHKNSDRIYRGSLEYGFGGQVAKTSVSPNALLPALKNFPEVEEGVRVFNLSAWNPFIVRYQDALFQEDHFYFADSSFFKVFSFSLLKGNPDKALTEPYSVILTKKIAKKYFGDEDPIGKTLTINNSREYKITGLMEDAPDNSLLQFEFIASFNSLGAGRGELTWWNANYQTFVLLHKTGSIISLEERINELVKKELAGELTNPGDYVRYNFIPLTDIHLRSEFDNEPEVVGDIKYVFIFAAIAFLVLVIATINYVNLATARASERAKEVSLRKVVGAVRQQLFFQFMGESIIITVLAFCLAFLLAQLSLPFFNSISGKHFVFFSLFQNEFLGYYTIALLVIATLAGVYPALIISAYNPGSVLKGSFKFSSRGIWLRKMLVVTQFSISIILIMGTLVINKQLNFIQQKKLGYDKENSIMLPYDKNTSEVYESLKTELIRTGAAQHVGRGSQSPVHIQSGYGIKTSEDSDRGIITRGLPADENYLAVFNMEFLDGRNFTRADIERVNNDTVYSFILNEAALAALSIDKEKAIGTKVEVAPRKGEIIGVVKDFHFSSLHQTISPLVIFPEESQLSHIFIKLPEGNPAKSLDKIKTVYSSIVPHRPFEYEFIDQQFASMYTAEQRMGTVVTGFATLAIIIACLGLVGLVSFSVVQKTKEISIRKVLGATATKIVVLITQDYTPLVITAVLIGVPIAYWTMDQWLSSFAYKESIGAGPVLYASLLCFIIAFGTAGYLAMRASFINPADNLRNE